tara:strand:+ start:10132 stop:11976 length:1845 start_codon:yes stop_codon:yes gene_type:complete
MSLQNQIAMDSRLMFDHATQVITEGASQVLTQTIGATQVNNNLISFNNILSIGQNVAIDPYISIQYQVSVTINKATLVANMPVSIICPPLCSRNNTAGNGVGVLAQVVGRPVVDVPAGAPGAGLLCVQGTINNANTAFAQYPLSGATNNLALSINNVDTNINLGVITSVCRENFADEDMRSNLLSRCPCDNNKQPALYQQAVGVNYQGGLNVINYITEQPNTPTSLCSGRSRVSSVRLVSISADSSTATYEIVEPILISPLSVGKGGAGLCNVNSLGVRFQLDTSTGLANMFNTTQDVTYAMWTSDTEVKILSANLLINYLTVDVVDHPIPNPAYYDWFQIDVNNTKLAATSGTGISLQSYKLTTIPKFYWIKCQPSATGIRPKNLMCGFPITTLQITYGSYGTFIFNQDQLYLAYRRNTLQTGLTYASWVAIGTPVCLSPSLDMCSANSFSGESNLGGLMWQAQVTYNVNNFAEAGVSTAQCDIDNAQLYSYELFVTQGSCAIGNGVAVFKNSSISMEEFAAVARGSHVVSENVVSASQAHGGKFNFAGFKSLLSSGAKKLGSLAIQHAPELIKQGSKMGLEALQKRMEEKKEPEGGGVSYSSGSSGGRMRRR